MKQRAIKLLIVLLTVLVINTSCNSTKNSQIVELEDTIKGIESNSEEVIIL